MPDIWEEDVLLYLQSMLGGNGMKLVFALRPSAGVYGGKETQWKYDPHIYLSLFSDGISYWAYILPRLNFFMSAYLCLLWPDALLKVEKLTILPTYCSVQIFCWSLKCAFFWFACSVSSAPVTASDNTRNPATTECLTLKLKEIWWSNPFLAVWTVVKYGELSLLLP